MGQTFTVFRPTNETALTPADPGESESPTSVRSDDEFFIRKTLEQEPERGVELLYSRYFQPLCTHTIRFVGSREVAEDLISEIFYQFYSEKIFQQITSSYRAYLFKTARNRAYNYLRWDLSRKVPLEEIVHPVIQESQQPDAITQYEELYQDVEKAIGTLPIQRRKIYLLHHFEGKRFKEIAGELQISVRTVEVQIYRSRQAIRQLLKEKWLITLLLGLLLPK
jgi:RNA polymerase sigma-70 factor (family 1)